METSQHLLQNDSATLPVTSANTLLQNCVSPASFNTALQSLRLIPTAYALPHRALPLSLFYALMNEAHWSSTGILPVQIACSKDASLSFNPLHTSLFEGVLVEMQRRLSPNCELFSFHVQRCHLQMLMWFFFHFPPLNLSYATKNSLNKQAFMDYLLFAFLFFVLKAWSFSGKFVLWAGRCLQDKQGFKSPKAATGTTVGIIIYREYCWLHVVF